MDSHAKDASLLKRAIAMAATRATTTDARLHELLSNLATLTATQHAYITELADRNTLRSIACWQNGARGPLVQYAAEGTPCADVLRDGLQVITAGLRARYPDDQIIQNNRFDSYVGCPIVDASGRPLGNLCVLGANAITDADAASALVSLFAVYIGQELQHRREREQLEEQQQQLQSFLSNLPGMAYRCAFDRHWTMRMVSAGCHALTGYERRELEGGQPDWATIIHGDDRERVWREVQAALAKDQPFELGYRIVTKDRRVKWVWERGSRISGGHGDIEGYIADVTPLKQSESALVRAEAYATAIVSTAADGIITIDAQGRVESFNSAAEAMLGYSASEVIGQNVNMLMPAPYHDAHDGYLQRYMRTGEAQIIGIGRDVTAQRKDGVRLPVHLAVSEIKLGGQRTFAGILRDLSAEKRAEEELRQQHEQLRVVIERAPVGIVTYGFNGPFLSVNRAYCEITGYSAAELLTMSPRDLSHPDDWAETEALATKSQHGTLSEFSQRKRYVRKDGAVIDIQTRSAATHDAGGRPVLIIAHVEDLTPRLKAEAEAREHRERLAHVDRLSTLGEMAAGIAHEINQPLTAISLFAQAGKRLFETGNYAKATEVFDKLSQHAQRAGAVIERMRGMSRSQDRRRELVDCNVLIADVAKLAEAEARIRDIAIRMELASGLPQVSVDVVQIQQVVLNLLRNGMEAMREADRRASPTDVARPRNVIRLRTSVVADGAVEVAVVDSGCGVSAAVASRLFQPFSTTKDTGMGMGLSISRAIINAHGGQLDYFNNATSEGGATFFFRLPATAQGDVSE